MVFCMTLLAIAPLDAQGTATPPAPTMAAMEAAAAYAAGSRTTGVLVMHDGRIVFERYLNSGSSTRRQMLASASKSFVGVGALAAAADGLLRLDQPVAALLPEWKADARKTSVTFRQLLSLESGLDPGSAGTGCGGPRSGWNDAIAAPSRFPASTRFAYGPFPFIVAGAAMERATRGETFDAYLARRILAPLGITLEWRARCADGKPQLAGGGAMTARDLATFGEFIRLGGVHAGKRILADTLIAALFRPSTVNPSYGMSWWLRAAAAEPNPALGPLRGVRGRARGRAVAAPDWLPADLVMAAGAGKQRLYVVRSRGLVIVRQGPVAGGGDFDDVEFLGLLFGPAPK